jgi:hypothetical protein
MARTHDAAIKIGERTPQHTSVIATLQVANVWWAFCVLVFAIKLSLLWLDPTPKLFMGDSGSYIWTALTGWIPPDRSYFYGYLIRWLAVWPHSFTPLLITQALASGVTAILFTMICSRYFEIWNHLCFLFGLLCAIDPCQLVWERYVMTETFSLLFYMLVLYWSLAYLRNHRIWQLAIVQVLSVVLIGFRMSYLPLVQLCTVLLPIIAFAWSALPVFRDPSKARGSLKELVGTGFEHLVISVALMFAMHAAYKHVNGLLTEQKPAYLYNTGSHLVAVWAPALQPSDATDPRLRDIIANGAQFQMHNLRLRNAQQFGKGFLFDRWSQIEKNLETRDRVARETAMNVLRRRPLEIVGLAVKTYLQYYDIELILRYARKDLGDGQLADDQVKMLAEKFGFITGNQPPRQPLSLLQRYFVGAWPYYFFVIISPFTCAFATWINRHRAFAFLLFLHAAILIVVITALSPRACIRYLQPVSILTLLSIAICVDRILTRTKPELAPVRPVVDAGSLRQRILKLRARGDSNTRPTD